MKRKLVYLALKLIDLFGFSLIRSSDHRNRSTMERTMQFLSKNTHVNTVIDIGASDGRWSLMAKQYFKYSKFHLIEGNPYHERKLKRNILKFRNATYNINVASSAVGEVFFDSQDIFGGVASKTEKSGFDSSNATTVDNDVDQFNLTGPFLIKFDTHGFEKDILLGSERTLEKTDVIVMECYNFKISEDAVLFWEMCDFLNKKGFLVADIVNQLYRPSDNFLWQIDIVFLRSERPEFQINKFN